MSFPDGVIDKVIREYVCAQCYFDLRKELAPKRKYLAICPTHGDCENAGRVTRSWAESEGQRRAARRLEIEYDYRPAPRQPEIVLAELGF